MGARVTAGWGGNRVYNGSKWMDLYYFFDVELAGDPPFALTGAGKIPNANSSVLARLKIHAVFDSAVTDTSNTRTQSGSWPSASGSVNISNTQETAIYNQGFYISPTFGATKPLTTTAALSGIDAFPGLTTNMTKTLQLPARAWGVPVVPAITGYTVNDDGEATVTLSGNQNDTGADKYWQYVDLQILRPSGWAAASGLAGNTTSYKFLGLVPNNRFEIQARSRNSDAGDSGWSNSLYVYSKPTAPTIISAIRNAGDRTKVDVSWVNTAAYPGTFVIERQATPADAWVPIGTAPSTANTYTDTYPKGFRPMYRVRVNSPDNSIASDYSDTAQADMGNKKQYIPGIGEIYLGMERIERVYWQGTELWLS